MSGVRFSGTGLPRCGPATILELKGHQKLATLEDARCDSRALPSRIQSQQSQRRFKWLSWSFGKAPQPPSLFCVSRSTLTAVSSLDLEAVSVRFSKASTTAAAFTIAVTSERRSQLSARAIAASNRVSPARSNVRRAMNVARVGP